MNEIVEITLHYTSICLECKEWINQGQTALWIKGKGVKHLECPQGIKEDNSSLVIIDDEDKKRLGWKN